VAREWQESGKRVAREWQNKDNTSRSQCYQYVTKPISRVLY